MEAGKFDFLKYALADWMDNMAVVEFTERFRIIHKLGVCKFGKKEKSTRFIKCLNCENLAAFKRYYIEVCIMFIIMLFFVLLLPLLRNKLPQLPFSHDEIFSINGILLSDAKPMKNGRFLYTMKIKSATSVSKITAEAEGALKVIAKGSYFYKGALIEIKTPYIANEYNYLPLLYFNPLPLINGKEAILLKESLPGFYRKKVAQPIFNSIEKIDAGDGLVLALLTGNRIELDPMLAENIRKSGCSHILALSGMHLGIVTMFVLFLFRKIAGKKLGMLFAVIFNFLFAMFAGMSAPLLRAFIFFTLAVFAKIIGRLTDLRKLFVLCFAVTILISPDEAGELSFQYSFLAVAGIIFLSNYLYNIFLPYLPPVFSAPFACTIAAQLPSWILSSVTFGEIYFSGTIASLVLSPLVTIFMLISFPGMIITLLTDISILPISFAIKIVSYLIHKCAAFFADFPVFKVNSISFYILIIINLFVILLAMFPYLINERYKILNILKRFK